MSFSKRLRQLRLEKRWRQEDLANILGVTKATISNYETTDRVPSVETMTKIAKIFGVTIDYLNGLTHVRDPDLHENMKKDPIIGRILEVFSKLTADEQKMFNDQLEGMLRLVETITERELSDDDENR